MELTKLDNSGDTIWNKSFDVDWFNFSMANTNDGGYIITGATQLLSGSANTDAYLIKIDSLGDVMWAKTIASNYWGEFGVYINQTNDNGFIMIGRSDGRLYFSTGGSSIYDIFLVKTDSIGNAGCYTSPFFPPVYDGWGVNSMRTNTIYLGSGGIANNVTLATSNTFDFLNICSNVSVDEYKIINGEFKVYPNPVNDLLSLDYLLPKNISQAAVNIYNYAGELVRSFAINSNHGTISQNVSNLSSGLYLLNIIANHITIGQQKIIISK